MRGASGLSAKTRPMDGLPHGPTSCASTVPASVSTAPPPAFCMGSGMSICWRCGHSSTVASRVTKPMTVSSPITTRAAVAPIASGSEWSWW
ncbi:Uncharacterised protein [Mycobacteroides abscessus subsp. abscessus]|nr:Uncharacterised protein [Mycobacteroides abscessus subsp. abscessus]